MNFNLVLLRHGQSYSNADKHVNHDTQNLLTAKGIEDTLRHARNLRTICPDLHFDHVFVSPMHRARQTAYNFLSTFDNNAIDIEIVEDFRERDFGFGDFRKMSDLLAHHGQAVVDSWDLDMDAIPAPGGDSINQVYNRVIPAFKKHVEPRLKAGQKIMVVSHYYVMKCLQSYIQFGTVNMTPVFEPKNCLPQPYLFNS